MYRFFVLRYQYLNSEGMNRDILQLKKNCNMVKYSTIPEDLRSKVETVKT